MTLEEKVVMLEKKLAYLFWLMSSEVPTLDVIDKMEKYGFNSSLEDKVIE